MADRLRREKDILKKAMSSYLTATTSSQYLKYFEGSPTYITYYQLDENASTHDIGLESVSSFIGANSPKKYKKIYEVQVWGVDAMEVSNDLTERGLQSSINGELLFLPDTIKPYANDYFSFEYEGLETHIFRITDVQFDKASPTKFFRCQYSLSNENATAITGNISGEYYLEYDSESGSNSGTLELISAAESASKKAIQELTDGLIDKYTKLFYNDDLDTFLYQSRDGFSYWSPYVQHFLHDTKALSKSSKDILTEIYIMDINEIDNPEIYSEEVYRNSLFRAIEIQDNNIKFEDNFISISDYDLKSTRNLPFFMSPLDFKLVTPILKKHDEDNPSLYINSLPLFFGDGKTLFKDIDHYHKVHILDETHLSRLDGYLKAGDILYECNRHELEPTKISMAIETIEGNEKYLEINDISIEKFIDEKNALPQYMNYSEIFDIIRKYLNGNIVISDDIVSTLNKYYYKQSLQTYLLIPMIVYILKESIS